MKRLAAVFTFGSLYFLLASSAFATTTVYYQPTPYATSTTDGVHIYDGWITNFYYGMKFINDDERLQVGGWGDTYNTYLKFDLEGLPSTTTQATLWMMPYWRGDSSNLTSVYLYRVTSAWDPSMTWSTQPTNSYLGTVSAPTNGTFWGNDITSIYNNWQSGSYLNQGLMFAPTSNSNNFDEYRSSQYQDDDGARPMLELTFVPPVTVPDFKMPLPGDLSWLVTTEVGGWDCVPTDPQDLAHTGTNYFSIDFASNNKDSEGDPQTSYDVGGVSTTSIPIVAAADGKVVEIGADPSSPNGYYIVIDHDEDGDIDTGFTTRYLHLKYNPSFSIGDLVSRGDVLDYMGDTGESTGMHLHFGTRYDNTGASTSTVQYAVNDGWLLKSFQTECDVSGDPNRYYLSSNQSF